MSLFFPYDQTPFSRRTIGTLLLGLIAWLGNGRSLAEMPVRHVRQANQASKRGVGSAGQLTGHVALYEIFVSDDLSSWPQPERDQARRRIDTAVEFLLRQARLVHQEFTWQRVAGRDVRHAGRLPVDPHADPTWSESVLQESSGMRGSALVQELRQAHGAEQVAVCLYINRPGISYNLAFYEQVRPEYATERMICFADYPDGRPTATATYAHELLHLFGAGDLYFPYDQTSDRKELARQCFPNDIMLRVDYDIERLTVGPFTAFRVGWLETLDTRWRQFED